MGESILGVQNGYRNCVLTWRTGGTVGVAIRHLASAQQAGWIDFRRRHKLFAPTQQRYYRLQTATR